MRVYAGPVKGTPSQAPVQQSFEPAVPLSSSFTSAGSAPAWLSLELSINYVKKARGSKSVSTYMKSVYI